MNDHGINWLATSTEISDHVAFARFLMTLAEDLRKNPQNWERIDLEDFLRAMAYWTMNRMEDFTRRVRDREVTDPLTWRTFADILSAARAIES